MISLSAGSARVLVDETAGARLASLVVNGGERLVTFEAGGPDPMRWGAYPMVPYAGRVRRGRFTFEGRSYQLPVTLGPHAIHGTVYAREWEVVSVSPASVSLRCPLGPDWPWDGWVTHDVSLDAGAVTCVLELHSAGSAFPGQVGWHPWFADGDAPPALAVDVGAMYRRDDDWMATAEMVDPGPHPWDDCFTGVEEPISLTYRDSVALWLTSDCDHWVIYEPDHAVCVEPQSGPPDGVTLDPELVTPDAPLSRTMEIRWTRRAGAAGVDPPARTPGVDAQN